MPGKMARIRRICERKKRYKTRDKAETVRLSIRMRDGADNTKTLKTYRCPACKKWHLENVVDAKHEKLYN